LDMPAELARPLEGEFARLLGPALSLAAGLLAETARGRGYIGDELAQLRGRVGRHGHERGQRKGRRRPELFNLHWKRLRRVRECHDCHWPAWPIPDPPAPFARAGARPGCTQCANAAVPTKWMHGGFSG